MPNDSQWPAQFATAAELARRGYSVAFFLGNEPIHDALVRGTSASNQFPLQVKGFGSPPPKRPGAQGTAILVRNLSKGIPSDFFALVYVPVPPAPFEFFIATRRDLQNVKNLGGPAKSGFTSDWLYWS
jgi:hypothetical protein